MANKGHSRGVTPHLADQADTEQASHVPYLPPEVHRIIARYVHSSELPNYRLASKCLAEIGAEELFNTVTFHCSSASIARINNIKGCERLNKYVRSMVWDTNFWRIPDVQDLHEWRRYFKRRGFAARCSADVAENELADRLASLEADRKEWGRYLDHTIDEKKAKKNSVLQNTFAGFENLSKLHILNGALAGDHRGVKKVGEDACFPGHGSGYWRGESLYNDGDHIHYLVRAGGHALAAIRSFRGISWRLTKLRMDAVCPEVFAAPIGVEALQNLSSLHIKLTLRVKSNVRLELYTDQRMRRAQEAFRRLHFMDFLARFPELESLKLDFSGRFLDNAPTTVHDIFPKHYTWPKLRKLSLLHVNAAPEPLLGLLERHGATLEKLNLHDIMLEFDRFGPYGPVKGHPWEWPHIFKKMKDVLRLGRATFSGCFSTTDTKADENLALAAATYLVKGGESPFKELQE